MIIGFDPIAKEVTIDFEDGRPPLDFRAETLLIKHYGDEGIFFAQVSVPDKAEVGFIPASDVPAFVIQAEPLDGSSWAISATPA